MNPVVIIFPAFGLFVLIAWAVGTYNKFIKYRNRIEESWSGIDVALKRRANIIPSLVQVIEGYGAHEAKIFQEKTRVIGGENSRRQGSGGNHLAKGLPRRRPGEHRDRGRRQGNRPREG